jgi:hypothetical protein
MKATSKQTTPAVPRMAPTGSDGFVAPIVPPLSLPQAPAIAQPVKTELKEQAGSAEHQIVRSKPQREARGSSVRKPRDRSSGASVLSMQSASTSSAAHLLGAMASGQQGADRPRRPKAIPENRSAIGETSGAESEIAGTSPGQAKPRAPAASSTQPQRRSAAQRAGGSVLSVKNVSSSSAAGLLGPLLEQKVRR